MDKSEMMLYFGPPLILLSIMACVGNIALCTLIVTSSRLRTSLRNWLMFGLAVVDLIAGVMMSLLVADLLNQVHHTCAYMLLTYTFVTYAMPFLNFWYLVVLGFDYCRRLIGKTLPLLSSLGRTLMFLGVVLIPWFLMFLFVVPGMVGGIHDQVKETWTMNSCPVVLSFVSALTLRGVACGLPIIILIVLSIIMVCIYQRKQRVGTYTSMSARSMDHGDEDFIEKPYCYMLPCFLNLICVAPLEIFGLVGNKGENYRTEVLVTGVLVLVVYAKAAIMPFLWLIIPDLRWELRGKFFKRDVEGSATYARFTERQGTGEVTITPHDRGPVEN